MLYREIATRKALRRSKTCLHLFQAAAVTLTVTAMSAANLAELHSRLKRTVPAPQQTTGAQRRRNPQHSIAIKGLAQAPSARDPDAISFLPRLRLELR